MNAVLQSPVLTNATPAVPDGYMRDARQRLVPIEHVRPIDKLRDQTVRELLTIADGLHRYMADIKAMIENDLETFLAISAQEYGVEWGGQKGNITLTTFDGCARVQIDIQERLAFSEQLQTARQLVEACIHRWAQGARSEIRALVDHAFRVDKEGQISTGAVFALLRIDIDDQEWRDAMKAVRDSVTVIGSARYVRFARRDKPDGKWEPLPLDFSTITAAP